MSRCFESGGSSLSITPQSPLKSFFPRTPARRPAVIETGMNRILATAPCIPERAGRTLRGARASAAEVRELELNGHARLVAPPDGLVADHMEFARLRIAVPGHPPHHAAELAGSEVA